MKCNRYKWYEAKTVKEMIKWDKLIQPLDHESGYIEPKDDIRFLIETSNNKSKR